MKSLLLAIAAAGLTAPGILIADSYTVFRVCEDTHVLRTSDGAEAGRVEYIVVDPAHQRIVSTIISGGVIGQKFVVVPFSSMRFGKEREITFTEITRERLVSAPVVEKTRFRPGVMIEPAFIQPTFTHFGVNITVAPGDAPNAGAPPPDRARTTSQDLPPGTNPAQRGDAPGRPGQPSPSTVPGNSPAPNRTQDLPPGNPPQPGSTPSAPGAAREGIAPVKPADPAAPGSPEGTTPPKARGEKTPAAVNPKSDAPAKKRAPGNPTDEPNRKKRTSEVIDPSAPGAKPDAPSEGRPKSGGSSDRPQKKEKTDAPSPKAEAEAPAKPDAPARIKKNAEEKAEKSVVKGEKPVEKEKAVEKGVRKPVDDPKLEKNAEKVRGKDAPDKAAGTEGEGTKKRGEGGDKKTSDSPRERGGAEKEKRPKE